MVDSRTLRSRIPGLHAAAWRLKSNEVSSVQSTVKQGEEPRGRGCCHACDGVSDMRITADAGIRSKRRHGTGPRSTGQGVKKRAAELWFRSGRSRASHAISKRLAVRKPCASSICRWILFCRSRMSKLRGGKTHAERRRAGDCAAPAPHTGVGMPATPPEWLLPPATGSAAVVRPRLGHLEGLLAPHAPRQLDVWGGAGRGGARARVRGGGLATTAVYRTRCRACAARRALNVAAPARQQAQSSTR